METTFNKLTVVNEKHDNLLRQIIINHHLLRKQEFNIWFNLSKDIEE